MENMLLFFRSLCWGMEQHLAKKRPNRDWLVASVDFLDCRWFWGNM